MTTFDERENAFEKKFARDEELRFKATVRRNKLFGLWVAEKLGLAGDEADAYAKTVVKSDFAEPGDEDMLRKVRADFADKNVDVSEHQMQRKLLEMMEKAVDQIEAGSDRAS